jgi:hypothetical protein
VHVLDTGTYTATFRTEHLTWPRTYDRITHDVHRGQPTRPGLMVCMSCFEHRAVWQVAEGFYSRPCIGTMRQLEAGPS